MTSRDIPRPESCFPNKMAPDDGARDRISDEIYGIRPSKSRERLANARNFTDEMLHIELRQKQYFQQPMGVATRAE